MNAQMNAQMNAVSNDLLLDAATAPRQDVSDKSAERVKLCNFATDDASPNAIPIAGMAGAHPGSDAQPPAASGRTEIHDSPSLRILYTWSF